MVNDFCEACKYEKDIGYIAPMFHACGLQPEIGLCIRCVTPTPATYSSPEKWCERCWKEWWTEDYPD